MARVKLSSLCCGWMGPSGLPCGLKSLYKCTAAAAAAAAVCVFVVSIVWWWDELLSLDGRWEVLKGG